ncbi:MAG: hypothetical protein WKF81_07085 [Thermomicrobiales bacterium]
MSDDQSKRNPESGGTETSPEYDQHTYKHLDRDQWYDDDESLEDDAPKPDVSSANAGASNPPAAVKDDDPDHAVADQKLALESAEASQTNYTDPIDEEADSATEPDLYDFGDAPQSAETADIDDVLEAEFPEPATDEPTDAAEQPEPEPTAEGMAAGSAIPSRLTSIGSGWNKKAGSFFGRYFNPVETALKPASGLVATSTQRAIVGIALVVALISLLADNSGFALMVLGFVVPLIVVLSVMRQDVFETEPPMILLGVGGVGLVVGLILGWLSSWIMREQWFNFGNLNFGAFGFGGRYADAGGNANFLVWLLNGILLPIIALAAIIALPIALRRYAIFRNEIMDGTILGMISATGFAIGTLIVFLSPGVSDGLPYNSVSDWTLIIFAVLIVKPVIITLGGAMLGTAIWRYMRDADINGMILPAAASVGAWLLLSLGTIQLQPAGVSVEFLWNLLIAGAVFVIYRRVVTAAVAIDSAALGDAGGRVVCPNCRKITPAATFCANCGESLE